MPSFAEELEAHLSAIESLVTDLLAKTMSKPELVAFAESEERAIVERTVATPLPGLMPALFFKHRARLLRQAAAYGGTQSP